MKNKYVLIVVLITLLIFLNSKLPIYANDNVKLSIPFEIQVKPYRDNYNINEPILILFNIYSKGGQITTCIEEKYYAFAIKLINSDGKINTHSDVGDFMNTGMFMMEKRNSHAYSSRAFITIYPEKSYESYLCLNEILWDQHWAFLKGFEPGKYKLIVKFTPYSKTYLERGRVRRNSSAWTGEAISNTIEISINN